jgi:hypothetical protein
MQINSQKLETLLIANWSQFINPRELLNYASEHARSFFGLMSQAHVNHLTISRFELTEQGFVVWIDYTIEKVRGTSEFLISSTGTKHISTIRN